MGELRTAVELDPLNVRFRYVYAIALNSVGDVSGAIRELVQANETRPSDRDVLLALINIHAGQGNVARARAYAEDLVASAPWDGNAKNLLDQLSN